MSETTPHLGLPYIQASQAQKHVTHNEALRALDGVVQLAVKDRNLTAPPGSPAEGDRYLVAAGATGAWSGWDGDIAFFIDGAWFRFPSQTGWMCWVEDEQVLLIRIGSSWVNLSRGGAVDLSRASNGATTGVLTLGETLSGLSGATVDSSIQIPDRAICLGVTTRTSTTITGATSYDCGIAGEAGKFGAGLGIAAGSTNKGVIGPQAFYADTPIRLTANGGNFTGGAVRIGIHCLTVGLPT